MVACWAVRKAAPKVEMWALKKVVLRVVKKAAMTVA
jgi:hypothetical protein